MIKRSSEAMESAKRTCKPKSHQQLKKYIEKYIKEGMLPILQAGIQVEGHSLLEAQELKGKEVAFINLEKLKKKKKDAREPKSIEITNDSLLKCLQERVGSKPKFFFEKFQNWAENQRSFVISCYPETKDEMSRVIKAAAAESVGIRCAGARHSWAPVFSDTCQVCVNIKNLKSDYSSLTKIRIADIQKRTVDVMTGVTTGDLKAFQLQTKLNLNANVILDLVQMVSVAQTGCHGVGKDTHCLSDYLVQIRVFDSNGELRTYSLEKDKDVFKAVSAAFGCFGIVYDVTFKMDPEIIVATTTSYPRMHETFGNEDKLRKIVEENWAVEIFWFPFNSFPFDLTNDEIWVRTFNKIPGSEKVEDAKFYETKDAHDRISQEALSIVSPLITSHESLVPLFQWLSFQSIRYILYPSRKIYQEIPHAIHFRKYLDLAEVYDLEFVFDYKGDYSRLKKIIQVVVTVVQQFRAKKQYPLNVSLEMRFMTSSDAYLGTGNIAHPRYGGSGHVVCIEVLSLKGTKTWEEFSRAVGKEWMELGGVPHLAKQYDHLPDIFKYIRQKMARPIADFKDSLKKAGVDPSLYLNTGMRKLLGYE